MSAIMFKQAAVIASEIAESVEKIDGTQVEALIERILKSEAVFVAGSGRSGLMIRAFAMRLMQMGHRVHVVGDTVTPAIGARDLLIIGSGSGETQSLVAMAQKAKQIGSSLAAITIKPESRIGALADVVVQLPGATKDQQQDFLTTVQPMASLFEQTMLVVLDAAILRLMEKSDQQSDRMFGLHANLE
ncbi:MULTISPECIES: 6-phospho-3-hexuloisomerase [Paenibacillus]|uniref:6-phospho-3-hexuloisomerase n=1 Tax=Paenibacillus campinasensis TaxID=66347 RepID=A0A268EV77_9BACL|nr:6-phospho-3-hexuloisomerase [Paenibacillus campinasensis]MUG66874.1 6-phospho-3-hexuloisomerase [Paenibacillus campinasensis]PAD76994.1 6-phospho-3-hexuloisomerase [Paenibacillus campinasensis]